MPSANEALRDALIRHQVALQRYSSGEVREILALLDDTQADLEALLVRRLQAIADGRVRSAAVTDRLRKLLANIRTMRLAAYRAAGRKLTADLLELGAYEVDFQARTIAAAAPVQLSLGLTTALEQVGDIVRSRPFQGLILRDWVADLADQELRAVERAISLGMAEGEGIPEIVRRIVGSRRSGIAGVLDISRRHAETWVRTAVSHTANETRDALYAGNADIVKALQWLSTLDTRTTAGCIDRDGHTYSLDGHEPLDGGPPWGAGPGRRHPKCRSTSVPVLRSWREMGIDLDEAPAGTRASMDGQVPAKTTYREWLQRQPASVQDEVLGVTRAKAMRAGRVQWDALFTPRGEFRSVRELGLAEGRSKLTPRWSP